MQIIKNIKDMTAMSRGLKGKGRTIGFVPTMGALHEGHLSLIRRSKKENDITAVSIYVNPAQFGPDEDFERYPRDEKGDMDKLSSLDVDTVFMPDNKEMYPEGFSVSVTVGKIGQVLCGGSRPGHFNGVATIVAKLFNIVLPDRAYFGQKDFQQTVIIKRLVRDLNIDTDIVVCPTLRESDGLAMSSRNTYLNAEERKASLILSKALRFAKELITFKKTDDASYVKGEIERLIQSEPLARIDYIDIVDTLDLCPVTKTSIPVAVCLAVKIGKTRLIDNIIISDSDQR